MKPLFNFLSRKGEIYETWSINRAARERHFITSKTNYNTEKTFTDLCSIVSYTFFFCNPKNMAMLRNKNITFSLILMCLIVASPIANAQLGGLGGGLGGLGGLLGGLTSIINIQGLLMCSVIGTVVSTNNTTVVPPFPSKFSILTLSLSINYAKIKTTDLL